MLWHETGVCSGSELFFHTPSDYARRMLFYMTTCGCFYTNYDYRIQRENYHNYLLFYIRSGRLSLTSSGRSLVASEGQVGLLNCHAPHEYYTIGSTDFVWLHLDGSNIVDFYHQIIQMHDAFVFDTPHAEKIRDGIDEIISSHRNEQPLSEIHLSQKLYGLLIAMIDTDKPARAAEDDPVQRAIQFMPLIGAHLRVKARPLEVQGPGDVPQEAGDAEAHVGGIALGRQQHRRGPHHDARGDQQAVALEKALFLHTICSPLLIFA